MEKLFRAIGTNPAVLLPATALTAVAAVFAASAGAGLSPVLPNLLLLVGCVSLLLVMKPITTLYLLIALSIFQNMLGYWFEALYVGTWRDILTLLILTLMAVKYTILRRGFHIRTPITGSLLLFSALLFVQIFNPGLPSIGIGILGFRAYFFPILGLFIGYNFISSTAEIKAIGKFLILLLTLASILGIIQSKMGFSSYENLSQYLRTDLAHYSSGYSWYRVSSLFGSVWEFGNLMSFMLLLLIPIYPTLERDRQRIVLFSIIAILFTGLISSASLSSIYSAFLGILAYTALVRKRRVRFLVASGLVITLSAVFMEKIGWERVILYFFSKYQHRTLWASVPFHDALLMNIKENFLGKGMGIALDSVGARFGLPTSIFKQLYPDWTMEGDYFRLMHQAGFPVMLLLMYIHGKITFQGLRIRNHLRDPFLKSLALGISLVMISTFVTSILRTFVAQRPLDLFIWIAVGILFSLPRLENKELEPAGIGKHPDPESHGLARWG